MEKVEGYRGQGRRNKKQNTSPSFGVDRLQRSHLEDKLHDTETRRLHREKSEGKPTAKSKSTANLTTEVTEKPEHSGQGTSAYHVLRAAGRSSRMRYDEDPWFATN